MIQSLDGHDEDDVVGGGGGGGGGWCFAPLSLSTPATFAAIFGGARDGVVTGGTGVDVDAILSAVAPTW